MQPKVLPIGRGELFGPPYSQGCQLQSAFCVISDVTTIYADYPRKLQGAVLRASTPIKNIAFSHLVPPTVLSHSLNQT